MTRVCSLGHVASYLFVSHEAVIQIARIYVVPRNLARWIDDYRERACAIGSADVAVIHILEIQGRREKCCAGMRAPEPRRSPPRADPGS
jgi:hypothetical protein